MEDQEKAAHRFKKERGAIIVSYAGTRRGNRRNVLDIQSQQIRLSNWKSLPREVKECQETLKQSWLLVIMAKTKEMVVEYRKKR